MWTWPQHHICEVCHQDMAELKTKMTMLHAWYQLWRSMDSNIEGSKYHFGEEGGRCHDCRIKHGGIHHAECDVEKCPVCDTS